MLSCAVVLEGRGGLPEEKIKQVDIKQTGNTELEHHRIP